MKKEKKIRAKDGCGLDIHPKGTILHLTIWLKELNYCRHQMIRYSAMFVTITIAVSVVSRVLHNPGIFGQPTVAVSSGVRAACAWN